MTLHVEVLQHHIDAGVRGNCRLCPIAVALQRATGEAWSIGMLFDDAIGLPLDRDTTDLVTLPSSVATFIRRFDAEEECHPFSFSVEVP